MSRTQELLAIFSAESYDARYAQAKANHTCIRCEGRAIIFRDALARLEYEVSALCQKCQDECFKS